MGFYSQINNTVTDLDLTGIQECQYEPDMSGALAIIGESEQNYNILMKSIGIAELNYFEENGQEVVYVEESASAFFETVKKFFISLWEKIKGLFKKFFAMMDSYTKSDKAFVEKYKKHLLGVDTRDFTYNGYEFGPDKTDMKIESVISRLDTVIGEYVKDGNNEDTVKNIEKKDDAIEKMLGTALGDTSLTRSEFSKELFKKFRKGEDSKQELDKIDVSDLMAIILGTKDITKTAKDNYKGIEKDIKDAIKEIENKEKELSKNLVVKDNDGHLKNPDTKNNGIAMRAIHFKIELMKEKQNIVQTVNGASLTAIRDQNRQAKAICVSLMNYKPKNESGIEGSEGKTSFTESFLSNVKFK